MALDAGPEAMTAEPRFVLRPDLAAVTERRGKPVVIDDHRASRMCSRLFLTVEDTQELHAVCGLALGEVLPAKAVEAICAAAYDKWGMPTVPPFGWYLAEVAHSEGHEKVTLGAAVAYHRRRRSET